MMDSQKRKKSRKGTWVLLAVIAVIVAAFALRFISLQQIGAVESIESVQGREGKPVELAEASMGEINRWITLAGTVEGLRQNPVISTNTIQIKDILRTEGEQVLPGDVIIRLIREAPNPMLHSYRRSLAVYRDAKRDLERMENLYGEGAVSRQALDKARLNYKVSETALVNASEGVNLKTSHKGIVTSITVQEGEIANAGEPLAWIASIDTVRVVFEAGSMQAMALKTGQRAVWRAELSGREGEGVISKLAVSADPRTHLLEGEAVFPNPDGSLVPGLLVSFDVNVAGNGKTLVLPNESIIKTNGGSKVFAAVESENGLRAKERNIETGIENSDYTEITSGLDPGDLVVKFGHSKLQDGDLIKSVKGAR